MLLFRLVIHYVAGHSILFSCQNQFFYNFTSRLIFMVVIISLSSLNLTLTYIMFYYFNIIRLFNLGNDLILNSYVLVRHVNDVVI